jgi:hypothetical protein
MVAEATLIRGGTITLKVVVSITNRFRVVARVAGEADSGAGGAAAAGQNEGGSQSMVLHIPAANMPFSHRRKICHVMFTVRVTKAKCVAPLVINLL